MAMGSERKEERRNESGEREQKHEREGSGGGDGDGGHPLLTRLAGCLYRLFITDRAAAMVASMSASVCAREVKPASNWEGAR